MKKIYIAPETELQTMNVEMPLALSIDVDGPGINYGGTGDDGDDPDVKEDYGWDEIWGMPRKK